MRPQDSTIRIRNWGTTTWQWNYVLTMRRHHEAFAELYPYRRHHHVASVELRAGVEAPPRPPMELRPFVVAPRDSPLKRVHGITSNRWGATKISHYKSRGIMPYLYFIHIPPTNQELPITLTSCITMPSCNSCFPIHTTQNNIPFPPPHHISIMTSSLIVEHIDQISNHTSMHHSTIVPQLTPSLAQANRSRSGEGDLLAQANPVSPRRELE